MVAVFVHKEIKVQVNKVTASGWKVGDFSVDLTDVNVLVGPNGSGKTSVLDAIRLCLYGEVPGLGKQNQAIMRGATGKSMNVTLDTSDGQRSVKLTKSSKGAVKKEASDAFLTPEVPLTVGDLMEMSGEQMRGLMSLEGDVFTPEQYLNDIKAEVAPKHHAALARCIVHGEGGLDTVAGWEREINDQKGREQSNVREIAYSLENTRKQIEEHQPVPKGVLTQWSDRCAAIEVELASTKKSLSECRENEDRAINSRRDLEDARKRLAQAKDEASRATELVRKIKKMDKADWRTAEADELSKQAGNLREKIREAANTMASVANASNAIEAMSSRCMKIVESKIFGEEINNKILDAKNLLDEVFWEIPPADDDDSSDLVKADELEAKAREITKEKQEFDNFLRQSGVSSVEHAEEIAKSSRLNVAAVQRECDAKENELSSYEESGKDQLEKKVADLQQELGDLRRKLSDAQFYADKTKEEAELADRLKDLEEKLEDMKVVSKAATKVQADYLQRPLEKITPLLDKFGFQNAAHLLCRQLASELRKSARQENKRDTR